MTGKDESPEGSGSWSSKVNPKRAKSEQSEREIQQGADALFAELFAPDAELQVQLKDSFAHIAEISNARLAATTADEVR